MGATARLTANKLNPVLNDHNNNYDKGREGSWKWGQLDFCLFDAPALSALVPTANEVSLTTFEADAGTTSSTAVQCDWVYGWQRRQRHSRRDTSWVTTRMNKSDQRWRTRALEHGSWHKTNTGCIFLILLSIRCIEEKTSVSIHKNRKIKSI